MSAPPQIVGFATAEDVVSGNDHRLVDVLDRLLDAGVVVRAELWLTVADVELVFIGADLFLSTPEKMRSLGAPPKVGAAGAQVG